VLAEKSWELVENMGWTNKGEFNQQDLLVHPEVG